MFKYEEMRSRGRLISKMQRILSILNENALSGLTDRVCGLRDRLYLQTPHSNEWHEIDKELNKLLDEIIRCISIQKGCVEVLNLYIKRIDTFIRHRENTEPFVINDTERNEFENEIREAEAACENTIENKSETYKTKRIAKPRLYMTRTST